MTMHAVDVLPEDIGDILVQGHEHDYVTETPTGLVFAPDTPIEVWGALVERLQRQQKLVEWAIADAVNFGEHAYGEMYAQWVEETGLGKRTLQNIASVGRRIESSRRREAVSFSHHAEVAYLPVPDQESLLDAAESAGMTRYELRDAVRERKEQLRGRTADAPDDPPMRWVPGIEDLTDEARTALEAHAPGGRHRQGYVAGFIAALVYAHQTDCFKEWRDG